MSKKELIIIINGTDTKFFEKNINRIILSKDVEINDKNCTLLQTDFTSLEDLIKAKQIISKQLHPINKIVIINKNIDLNMISYQHDYNIIKDNYLKLSNLLYFINLLIKNFDKKIDFILSFEKNNHYKVHTNIFNESITNYLIVLKKDLKDSYEINIKKSN